MSATTVDGSLTAAVTQITAGTPSFSTFTLELNGVQSQPLSFDATEEQVEKEVRDLFGPVCPDEILGGIGTYFHSF